jgi:hypothetical protein
MNTIRKSEEDDKERQRELELERVKENERIAERARVAKAEADRIHQEAIKKREAELAPDIVKAETLAKQIKNFALPVFTTKEGQKLSENVTKLMMKVNFYIEDEITKWNPFS